MSSAMNSENIVIGNKKIVCSLDVIKAEEYRRDLK